MSSVTPRVRMFAGPNGSGKSTLKSVLIPELLGVYLNPDEIEATIKRTGTLIELLLAARPGEKLI